jgi:homoserine O-acetyltransferase
MKFMTTDSKTFTYPHHFELENGKQIPFLEIGYTTFGSLNENKDNVIWVCHALTANSDAADWWHGLIGADRFFNFTDNFIVCANMLGSCYGSSGPLTKDADGTVYGKNFPQTTIRDNVKAQKLLFDFLGLQKIKLVLGGSMGGQQALEWSIMHGHLVENAALIACSAYQYTWAKALNATQRLAIEADTSWKNADMNGGMNGMKAARAIALLSYRSYETYNNLQSDESNELLENFKVESYQRYQGEKLAKRFFPAAYYSLTKTMDSHNIARGRKDAESVLKEIEVRTLVVSISSDILFPPSEQQFLAKHIPGAVYKEIESIYGHDGFLVEFEKLKNILKDFLQG